MSVGIHFLWWQRHASHSHLLQDNLQILTACLGQCPDFVHVRLAIRPVHFHHDEVLVGASLFWPAGGRGWQDAASSWCDLCWEVLQVWRGLDTWEGANGMLVDQGQVGIQGPLGARVGRGDRGVDG